VGLSQGAYPQASLDGNLIQVVRVFREKKHKTSSKILASIQKIHNTPFKNLLATPLTRRLNEIN